MLDLGKAGVAALLLGGCATSSAEKPPSVLYDLSSPDVGVAWHLHAKDGALLCELPCRETLPEQSGAWLGVHDPKKSWRVDLPSMLPAPPGSRVLATAHVGTGSPALGTIGTISAVTGATFAVSGVALLLASLFSLSQGCVATHPTCSSFDDATLYGEIGAPMLIGGAILAVIGAYWKDHNEAPALRIVPTGVGGTF